MYCNTPKWYSKEVKTLQSKRLKLFFKMGVLLTSPYSFLNLSVDFTKKNAYSYKSVEKVKINILSMHSGILHAINLGTF